MRDLSLDLLKGVACALMVLAHTQLQVDFLSKALTFLGGFTPILFFAVSGITADFQSRKHPVAGVFFTYASIFVLGLGFASMIVGNFWAAFDMDILQIIPVGVLVLYLIQRRFKAGPWLHLGAAAGVFALKLATDPLPRDSWWMAYLTNIVVEPGNFVLIPWLFPFFLGMFCYLAPNRHNLWLAMGAVLGMGLTWTLGIPLGIDNRWDMTIGYFLASLVLTSVSFFVARALPRAFVERLLFPLIWLGERSLLFLYVHIAIIWAIRHYSHGIWGTYWIWPTVTGLSVALMWILPVLLGALRVPAVMTRLSAWLALATAVLVAPLVLPNGAPLVLAQLALGTVFAMYYGSLAQILKKLQWPVLGRQQPG